MSITPPAFPRVLTVLLGGASLVVLLAGLQALAWLIGPVMLAFVVVVTVQPVAERLRARGLPTWASTVLLVAMVYAVIVVLAGIVVVSLARLVTILPQYRAEATALVGDVTGLLAAQGVGAPGLREITASLDLGRVVGAAGVVLSGVVGLAGSLVFLLSVLLFLSLEAGGFRAKLAVLAAARPAAAAALVDVVRGTRRFLVVTTIFGGLTAVADVVLLLALGVPLALLWGLLAFITNYVPYVGFLIGVVPPALLALLGGGWSLAITVVVLYTVINFVICSVVQPRFIGDAVGLSLTVVFLSLGFWAWLLGPLGAVLAIPLTVLVKGLLLDADPRTRWVSALLAARAEAPHTESGAGATTEIGTSDRSAQDGSTS